MWYTKGTSLTAGPPFKAVQSYEVLFPYTVISSVDWFRSLYHPNDNYTESIREHSFYHEKQRKLFVLPVVGEGLSGAKQLKPR